MSSVPPIYLADRPFGPVRHRRRRGRLKIESMKVKMAQEDKTAYLERARLAQPPGNHPNRRYGVVGPWRRRVPIKIAPIKLKIERFNDKKQQKVKTTYLGRAQATQPRGYPSKRSYGDAKRRQRRGRLKIELIKVNKAQKDGNTYRICASTTQPRQTDSKRLQRVIGPRCRRGRIKSRPTNVSRTPTLDALPRSGPSRDLKR